MNILPAVRPPAARRERGFTVIELMIGLVIVGVLLGIGVPSYSAFIKNQCLANNASALQVSLAFARSEAIKRRATVKIKPAATTATNEFGTGWTVYVDSDSDNSVDSGEELRVTSLTSCASTAMNSEVAHAAAGPDFQYTSAGAFQLTNGTSQEISVYICDDRTDEDIRELTIVPAGRASVTVYKSSSASYATKSTACNS